MSNHEEVCVAIEAANRAAQRRDWTEASRCWAAVLKISPHHATAYAGAGTALRESGRLEEAERILEQGSALFPEHESIAMASAWAAHARRDWQVALDRWKDIRERFPGNPWGYLGNIHSLEGAGRSDEVAPLLEALEELLNKSRRRGGDAAAQFNLEIELAKARRDWDGVRGCALEAIATDAIPLGRVYLELAQACWHLGERDEADEAASNATKLNPELAEAVVVRAWVATDRGDGEMALSCYRRLSELNPGAARWPLKAIQLMNRLGRVTEAMSELARVRGLWPDDPMVRMFLQNYGPASALDATAGQKSGAEYDVGRAEQDELRLIAERAPRPEYGRRPPIVSHAEKDVLVAEVAKAETAVLVFAGSNDAVSMPLQMFDRYLAALDVTAIYLKDFNRLRFLTGIRSLSGSYEGTVAALREMLRALGVKRICTLGNCDGGFAAIRYGVELGAERTVTFGAPTHSGGEASSRIEQARNFMAKRLAANVPPEMMDLRLFLEGRDHCTEIELFYEEEDARDRSQALHIAGSPGVRLRPRPGLSNHYLLRKLALADADFAATLAGMLGVESAARV